MVSTDTTRLFTIKSRICGIHEICGIQVPQKIPTIRPEHHIISRYASRQCDIVCINKLWILFFSYVLYYGGQPCLHVWENHDF